PNRPTWTLASRQEPLRPRSVRPARDIERRARASAASISRSVPGMLGDIQCSLAHRHGGVSAREGARFSLRKFPRLAAKADSFSASNGCFIGLQTGASFPQIDMHRLAKPFQAFPDFVKGGLGLAEFDAVRQGEDIHERSDRGDITVFYESRPIVGGAVDHRGQFEV